MTSVGPSFFVFFAHDSLSSGLADPPCPEERTILYTQLARSSISRDFKIPAIPNTLHTRTVDVRCTGKISESQTRSKSDSLDPVCGQRLLPQANQPSFASFSSMPLTPSPKP